MAQETSERACDRCRERRVKCDKTQPTCHRCEKLGKPCPGYDKKRKFVDEGVTLRKKYQSSSNAPSTNDQPALSVGEGTGPIASATSAPVNAASVPLLDSPNSVPSHAFNSINQAVLRPNAPSESHKAFLADVSSTTLDGSTDAVLFPEVPMPFPLLDTDPTLDDLWENENFDPQYFDLIPDDYYQQAGNTCGFIPNIPEIVDEVDQSDILINPSASTTPLSTAWGSTGLFSAGDSNLWAPESQLKTSAQLTHERDHEMAYLIRYFTESVGPWMDLFDRDRHFTHLVPLKALQDALLRNAIAAVAAKQLGRVKGQRPFAGQQCQKPSAMELLDDSAEIDWFYKAANYYDKAIAFSRQYLQAMSGNVEDAQNSNMPAAVSAATSDDLLVAISIFSLYESLDNLNTGWLQHLAGLKSLLTAVPPTQQSDNQIPPFITVGRLASFWNFVRADYQAAYLNHQRTLLDTDDISLWNSCGLEVQADGALYTSTDLVRKDPAQSRALAELVAHTLLWLVLRVMNYLASDLRQSDWDQLTRQLDHWYGNLPGTYRPVAQIRHPLTPNPTRSSPSPLVESFYSIDVCAASLQLYHFARILLLLHRPVSTTGGVLGNRLKQYREVSHEAVRHAHEIIGIAIGRPQPAIRVEMLLPLHTAGACLEENEERRLVLDLLRAIEQDTGYATSSKCYELVQEWGWAKEPEAIA